MAAITNRLGPILKGMPKLYLTGLHVDRLCFRSVVFVSCRVHSVKSNVKVECSPFSSEFPVLNVRELDSNNTSLREQFAFHSGCLWVDRAGLHAVLEKSADFQETVFSEEEFTKFLNCDNKWDVLEPTKDDFAKASVADLMDFVRFQTGSMGRDDYRLACQHIAGCLHGLSNSELLDLAKTLYFVALHEGNSSILWTTIDAELVSRFHRENRNADCSVSNFYLQALDLLYWLNCIGRSSFANLYLCKALKREDLSYSSGVQLLFYACCAPWEWRSKFEIEHLVHFLNKIKNQCSFNVFLVAVESFTALQFVRQTVFVTRNVALPSNLQRFLLSKATLNVDNDNTLTVIAQLLYSCPSKGTNHDHFHELLNKISERNGSISFLVIFYVLQAMAKCGIRLDGFYEVIENCLFIDSVHPRILCSYLLSLYGTFGPKAVKRLAHKVDQNLKKQHILPFFSFSPKSSLEMFCVLLHCGANAFHMWEPIVQGNFVADFTQNKNYSSRLHTLILTADDCIEAFSPEYKGSRLKEELRMQLNNKNYKTRSGITHNYDGFVNYLEKLVNGPVYATHILPGLSVPDMKDVVLSTDEKGKFVCPIMDCYEKPWNVKKIPRYKIKSNQTYFAVWFCPPHWPSFYATLKHSALLRLGYISVKIDTDLWNSIDEMRDFTILQQLCKYKYSHKSD